jgi:hypothetical protein
MILKKLTLSKMMMLGHLLKKTKLRKKYRPQALPIKRYDFMLCVYKKEMNPVNTKNKEPSLKT